VRTPGEGRASAGVRVEHGGYWPSAGLEARRTAAQITGWHAVTFAALFSNKPGELDDAAGSSLAYGLDAGLDRDHGRWVSTLPVRSGSRAAAQWIWRSSRYSPRQARRQLASLRRTDGERSSNHDIQGC